MRLGLLFFAVPVVDVDRERREGSAAGGGVGNVPAFDLTPEDAVQPLGWRGVGRGLLDLSRRDRASLLPP